MIETIGGILGGLGLLFFGMSWLRERIKATAGPRMRLSAASLVGNRFAGLGLGGLAGVIAQSSPAVAFISVSMMRSGLITTRQGFLIALGAQLGVSFLILAIAFDIKVATLIALGVSGIAFFRLGKIQYRDAAAIVLGLALIIFGLILIKESSASLGEESWFQGALEISTRSLLLSLALGAILTFVVQSGLSVLAFGIILGAAGVLEAEHVLMCIYGVFVGLGLIIMTPTIGQRGILRQMGMFGVFINVFPAIILVPLLYVELHFGVPLVKAFILSLDVGFAAQMSVAVILYGTPSHLAVLTAPDRVARMLSRFSPPSEIEQISQPQYILDHALHDAETSLDLVRLEQIRVLKMFSGYLEMARGQRSIGEMRESVGELNDLVRAFLAEIGERHPLYDTERANSMLSRQRLITWLEQEFADMYNALEDMSHEPLLDDARSSLIEGTDGAFLVFLDALEGEDEDLWKVAEALMADRRELMQEVRARYFSPETGGNGQGAVRAATNAVEGIFVLLKQLTQECQQGNRILTEHRLDTDRSGLPISRLRRTQETGHHKSRSELL